MKKYITILILLVSAVFWCGPVLLGMDPAAEMRTASGIAVVYRPYTVQKQGDMQLLRELDREVSRLFRAPPGLGSCRIVVDRSFTGTIAFKIHGKVREILLPEAFSEKSSDLRFRGLLAGEILGGRYGLPGPLRPLPGWMVYGMEGIRKNAQSAGRIVRNLQYYPILRGLLGIDCMPDFRALMQLDDCEFSGIAGETVCEFGRFLLETFAGISGIRQNALGDYAAEMLKGERREPDIYRTTLLPAMTSGRNRGLTEAQFFKIYAERAAFNSRSPRPAAVLLARLPEMLTYEVPSAADSRKMCKGNVMQLPAMLAEKKPEALLAQQQLLQKLQRFFNEFPPEILSGCSGLVMAVNNMSGRSPEAECAAVQKGRLALEKQLQDWMKVEKYLDECEQKYVRPGLLFRSELSTLSEEGDFLTSEGIEFFDKVEMKYLEH